MGRIAHLSERRDARDILVIRWGGVGDLVLTLPALYHLRRSFRRARVTIGGDAETIRLAASPEYADDWRPLDPAIFSDDPEARKQARRRTLELFARFDLIVNYHPYPSVVSLLEEGSVDFLSVDPNAFNKASRHALEHFFAPLESLEPGDVCLCPRVFLSEEERRWAAGFYRERGLDPAGSDGEPRAGMLAPQHVPDSREGRTGSDAEPRAGMLAPQHVLDSRDGRGGCDGEPRAGMLAPQHVLDSRDGRAGSDGEPRAGMLTPQHVLDSRDGRAGSDQEPRAGTPVLALHAGSGNPRKRWATGRFIEVGRWARAREMTLLLLSGAMDGDTAGEIAQALGPGGVHVVSGLSLRQVAALLERATLYVGNDSGLMHLATAVGTPVVAVFGPSSPWTWGPVGAGNVVLHGNSGCRTCTLPELEACQFQACLDLIRPDEVIGAIENQLAWLDRVRGQVPPCRLDPRMACLPAVQEPGLAASYEEPALAASYEEPALAASYEEPALAASREEPSLVASREEPSLAH